MAEDRAKLQYQGAEGRAYHETKRAIPAVAYPWVARLRREKIAPYVRAENTVLEYGVGFGWNLALLKCRRRIGFDISDYVASANREHGIEFVQETAGIPAASIDVVICHHVLEHLLDPPSALEEMSRLLQPQGTLLLFTPFEKERRFSRYRPDEPNHHLYSWNVQTLGNLVQACGFQIVEVRPAVFRFDRFAAVWAACLHLGEKGFRFIRKAANLVQPEFEVRLVARRV